MSEFTDFEDMNGDQDPPEIVEIELSRLETLLIINEQGQQAKKCLTELLAAFNELEKVGIIAVLDKMLNAESLSAFSLLAPIGRIIPKAKKFKDNENIQRVFSKEFFEKARKIASA